MLSVWFGLVWRCAVLARCAPYHCSGVIASVLCDVGSGTLHTCMHVALLAAHALACATHVLTAGSAPLAATAVSTYLRQQLPSLVVLVRERTVSAAACAPCHNRQQTGLKPRCDDKRERHSVL